MNSTIFQVPQGPSSCKYWIEKPESFLSLRKGREEQLLYFLDHDTYSSSDHPTYKYDSSAWLHYILVI